MPRTLDTSLSNVIRGRGSSNRRRKTVRSIGVGDAFGWVLIRSMISLRLLFFEYEGCGAGSVVPSSDISLISLMEAEKVCGTWNES